MKPAGLRPLSTTDALADALRERILSGEIGATTALPEGEIAARFGVARPTVRAAIQVLVFEGLLRRERNRSAYVPRLTADEIRDLFVVRKAIETHAVVTLAERGERPVAAERALKRHEAAGSETPWTEVVEAATDFHRGLIDAVDSVRLSHLHSSLAAEIRFCHVQLRERHGGLPPERATEHRAIFEAVVGRDAALAAALLRDHLDGAVGLTLGELAPAAASGGGPRPSAARADHGGR